jgi:hypothetical protein
LRLLKSRVIRNQVRSPAVPARLIQPRRGFGMCKSGEERGFDRLALVRRERCRAQRLALIAQLKHVVRIGSHLGLRVHVAPSLRFFRLSKRRRSIAREHDPAEHRAVRGVVTRRAPPNVMEDVEGELSAFSRLAVIRMIKVKTMRCALSYSACSASGSPVPIDWTSLAQSCSGTRTFDIEHVTHRCRGRLRRFLAHDG